MRGRTKLIGAIAGIVAILIIVTFPFWSWLYVRTASAALRQRAQRLVDQNPQLQAAWAKALQDNVLTRPEAVQIVEQAGEKVSPQE